jgi:hypothetical protein
MILYEHRNHRNHHLVMCNRHQLANLAQVAQAQKVDGDKDLIHS